MSRYVSPHSGKIVGLGSEFSQPDKSGSQDGKPPMPTLQWLCINEVVNWAQNFQ